MCCTEAEIKLVDLIVAIWRSQPDVIMLMLWWHNDVFQPKFILSWIKDLWWCWHESLQYQVTSIGSGGHSRRHGTVWQIIRCEISTRMITARQRPKKHKGKVQKTLSRRAYWEEFLLRGMEVFFPLLCSVLFNHVRIITSHVPLPVQKEAPSV